jgi:rod shape-determining protein MreD|uniref:Rod shape-determining protein MreD n=1 Tax=Desulfobacca acetoxidans TaxID=60893 RepID=A0A7V6A1D2_9BACT
MISSLAFFMLLGLALFYLNGVLLHPQVYIRPLAPLLFYVSLREPLPKAFILAVFLGLLQDSYAATPFGVHLLSSLILVGLARLARRTFLVKSAVFLIVAMLVALILQEVGVRVILTILGSQDLFFVDLSWTRALEIIVTALLTPVFFSLIRTLERHFGRLGRSRRQTSAAW